MLKKKKYKIASILLFCSNNFIGQSTMDTTLIESFNAAQYSFKFKPNTLSETDILNNYLGIFGLGSNGGLKKWNESTDVNNDKVIRYEQTFNNVAIQDSRLNLQFNSNANPTSANGKLFDNININTVPAVGQNDAIQNAIYYVGAQKYDWQDSTLEADIKLEKNDSTATNFPTAELKILPVYSSTGITYNLVYKIRISSLEPHDVVDIFIDASSGSLIQKRKVQISCNGTGGCQQGSAGLHAYGSQYIYTDKFAYGIFQTCRYRTKDNCTGTTLYTRRYAYPGPQIYDFSQTGNVWSSDEDEQDAVTAHWSLERSHDYFRFNFGRNSWNGNYSQLSMYLNASETCNGCGTNSYWTGNGIKITKKYGNYSHPFVFLDQIGHEFTHGITQTTSGLIHQGESGALNEGFSDIFGTMVEYYAFANYAINNSSPNYLIGENSLTGGYRNISNPKQTNNDPTLFNQPSTYGGVNWQDPGNLNSDDGGVHSNSGVLAYWFYLIAEGGNGTIDDAINGSPYCVQALGKDIASRIAWRTLTLKLFPSANFSNCREQSIIAATELYGANSNEVAQVTAAWYAVGVGSNYSGPILIQNHTANGVENYNYNNTVQVQNFTANNGSDVTITSNTEIVLLQGLNVNQGAKFSAYIAPACNGGARSANSPSNYFNNISVDKPSIIARNGDLKKGNLSTNLEPKIIPNPNSGNFKLILDNSTELPQSIKVLDVLGNVVAENISPDNYEFDFNISNFAAGVYIVKINYTGSTVSKRIIKN